MIAGDQVATVYRRFYWNAVAGAQLPDGADYAVFDYAVNSGPSRAAKAFQAVCGVKEDGKIGSAMLKAAKSMMRATAINDLCDKRMAFLKVLKTWKTFGKGWTSRVSSARADALSMAAQRTPENPTVVNVVVPIPVDAPTVPHEVEAKVKEKTNRWSCITSILGGGGIGLGWLTGMDWQAIVAGGVVLTVVLRSQIIGAVKDIREAVEN